MDIFDITYSWVRLSQRSSVAARSRSLLQQQILPRAGVAWDVLGVSSPRPIGSPRTCRTVRYTTRIGIIIYWIMIHTTTTDII